MSTSRVGFTVRAAWLLAGLVVFPGAPSPWAQELDLYDPTVLRTIELKFSSPSFFTEIESISSGTSDGYVTADLVFEGVTYPGVGVRFRGNTSQRNAGQKRSFKIAVDYTDPDQRLHGYRKLKLNNAAYDPSFLRDVMYSQITSRYFPAPTANFVKLVLNGESWGVYANIQFFNKDLLQAWFERTGGDRWKAPSGGGTGPGGVGGGPGGGFASGDRALKWLGAAVSTYQSLYQLKTDDTPDAWERLVAFCDVLNNESQQDLETAYTEVLDVDGALWMIACENVFSDEDSYLFKGADYTFYVSQDRFYLVQHDGNETFRDPGTFSLFQGADNSNRPLVQKLLAVPHLRLRYLAHVRTLLEEWLDWSKLEPVARALQNLIAAEVEADSKKLYSTSSFYQNFETTVQITGGFGGGSVTGIKEYVESKRSSLLAQAQLAAAPPVVTAVKLALPVTDTGWEDALAGATVGVQVTVADGAPAEKVLVYHARELEAPFTPLVLVDDGAHGDGAAGDGVYGGEIPAYPGGTDVKFYAEARGAAATAFFPVRAQWSSLGYHVGVTRAESTPIVINELMASNTSTLADPQGEFDDWVELLNVSNAPVSLEGMYLSDSARNVRKWEIPAGMSLAPGERLIVFLDEDGSADGLHANFKLSASGERLLLVDTDGRLNQILDLVEFGELADDTAYGRSPDGSGAFAVLRPTPGASNSVQAPGFNRGDVNQDTRLDLSDAVNILGYLFLEGAAPACLSAADADDTGAVNLTDAVYLLNFLFRGGAAPPAPSGACGADGTLDALGCDVFRGCVE